MPKKASVFKKPKGTIPSTVANSMMKRVAALELVPEAPQVDKTEIVCVLDRSGSMASIRDDAIKAFNKFLTDQMELPGEATMTIALFDDQYELVCSNKPVRQVKPLTDKTFVPRGSTALNDAIGRTINELDARKPKKAIFAVLTDGQENASKEFTKQTIKELIRKHTDDDKWLFVYLSASPDAFSDASSYGVSSNSVLHFQHDARGASIAPLAFSFASADYRSTGRVSSMATYGAQAASLYDSGQKPTNAFPFQSISPQGFQSKPSKKRKTPRMNTYH